MPINPKDVPYLEPREKAEIVEPRCLNCGEKREDHVNDRCLLWPSSWRTDARTLIDVDAKSMIHDPDMVAKVPKVKEEEADPDDPMVALLKKAVKN